MRVQDRAFRVLVPRDLVLDEFIGHDSVNVYRIHSCFGVRKKTRSDF